MSKPDFKILESFFNSLERYPDGIRLDGTLRTPDGLRQLVQADITLLNGQRGKKGYLPYYLRLLEVYTKIQELKP